MIRFALVTLVALAAPAAAQQSTPRADDYVESVCSGGIAARVTRVRVFRTGEVEKSSSRSRNILRTRATDQEVNWIWQKLDQARFEDRRDASPQQVPPDYIVCSVSRAKKGRTHSVKIDLTARNSPRYRSIVQALDAINKLGDRATGPIIRPIGTP